MGVEQISCDPKIGLAGIKLTTFVVSFFCALIVLVLEWPEMPKRDNSICSGNIRKGKELCMTEKKYSRRFKPIRTLAVAIQRLQELKKKGWEFGVTGGTIRCTHPTDALLFCYCPVTALARNENEPHFPKTGYVLAARFRKIARRVYVRLADAADGRGHEWTLRQRLKALCG